MHTPDTSLTIGKLAQAASVNVETIRFYQRKNLLPEPVRPLRGVRRYHSADVARVHFIKAAQRLGFTLVEIAELLSLADGTHCEEARRLAKHKLDEVCLKLNDLHRIEAALGELIARCGSSRGTVKCPLIASLQDSA